MAASEFSAFATDVPASARNYWAFKLPEKAEIPRFKNFEHPIDSFLEQKRQEKGIEAAPQADKLTLLRRAYLDLVGLPPTPEQTQEFLNDTRPNAWVNLIDKLLASPHYGDAGVDTGSTLQDMQIRMAMSRMWTGQMPGVIETT